MPNASLVKVFSLAYSHQLWAEWISPEHGHLMRIDLAGGLKDKNRLRIYADWKFAVDHPKDRRIKIRLQKEIAVLTTAQIYCFWNAGTGVETTWGVFLDYWTDFCYSGDDVDRFKEFGRK
jgi:hypothetical protein